MILFVVLLLNMANTAAPINILAASDIQHLRQRKLGQVLSYLIQNNAYKGGIELVKLLLKFFYRVDID